MVRAFVGRVLYALIFLSSGANKCGLLAWRRPLRRALPPRSRA